MKTKNDLIWSLSLLIIGIGAIILTGANLIEIELPEVVVRIIGIVDLIALPILAYTTVK